MKRMLKYEMRRISFYKKYFIFALCVIALVLFCLLMVFVMGETEALPQGDKAKMLESYQTHVESLESFIKDSGQDYNSPQFSGMRQNIERYKFFLSTGTTELDYFEIEFYMKKYEHHEMFALCFFLCEYSLYPFLIATVFSALWAFSFEKSNGTLKNLLQGSGRRTIFDSKLLVSAVLALGLPLILFLIELILMSVCRQRPFLIYDNGYKVMKGVALLAQMGLRNLLLIAFVYAATLLCTTFFKPLVSGLAVPLCIIFIGFIAMIASAEQSMVFLNKHSFNVFTAFPVVGLLNYAGGFDLTFAVMAILHSIAIAAFIFSARFRFLNKDV